MRKTQVKVGLCLVSSSFRLPLCTSSGPKLRALVTRKTQVKGGWCRLAAATDWNFEHTVGPKLSAQGGKALYSDVSTYVLYSMVAMSWQKIHSYSATLYFNKNTFYKIFAKNFCRKWRNFGDVLQTNGLR